MKEILTQVIGAIAMILAIVSFQAKNSKRILTFQVIGSTCWTVHFVLLGAYAGALLNIISVIRNLIFYQKDKKWARSVWWIPAFSLAGAVIIAFTWDGLKCLLPLFGVMATTVSFFMTDANKLRCLSLIASPLWLVYDALNGSYFGTATEVFCIVSIIIALIRYSRPTKQA